MMTKCYVHRLEKLDLRDFLWAILVTIASFSTVVADDARIHLTVKRDGNLWMGRAANVYAYVNGQHVGTLTNGEQATFAFQISSDAIYKIKFTDWTGLSDNTLTVQAQPDENIVCSVGTGTWGWRARDPFVEPLYVTKIFFETDRPRKLLVNEKEYSIATSGFVELPLKTTASGIIRVEYGLKGEKQRYPLFISPAHVPLVELSQTPTFESKLLVSEEFLIQLELARLFHFWSENPTVFERMDTFCGDVAALRPTAVGKRVLEYRDAEIEWLRAIRPIVEKSVSVEVASNAIASVLACTLEAIVTRQPPTQASVAWESFQVAFSASHSHFSRNRNLRERFDAIVAKRSALFHSLKVSDEKVQGKQLNAAYEDWRIRRRIVGEWQYEFPLDRSSRSYVFQAGGVLKETKDGQVVGYGSYVIDERRVVIRWPSGSTEVAQCNDFSACEFKYRITSHSGDADQEGLELVFSR